MLTSAQRRYITSIAEGWLQSGAPSFSVWRAGQPVASWPAGRQAEPGGLRAPVRVGGKDWGELHVETEGRSDAARLATEARLLGGLLETEGHLEEMTVELIETQDQLLAMYELTQATRDHLGMGESLRRLAQQSARLLKTEGAVLFLAPTLVQYPANLMDERLLIGSLLHVLESGRELVISSSDGALPPELQNLCAIPIRVRGSVAAVLGLYNRTGDFSAPDLKLARAIAEQAGAQIEHTLLYGESLAQARLSAEMEVARRVQLQLLPQKRPQVPGLDIFAQSRPALQVGGDFYDFMAANGRPLTLLIGDVAGKGISAAMIMGMICAVSRSAMRFMPRPTPASVLGRVNNDLYDDLTILETFTTAFVCQFDPHERQLRYANAGHAPVIYRPPGGPARMIESDGTPIGVLPVSLCEDHTLDFGPGSLLIATTDGFNEARGADGEMFGYERLLEMADEFAEEPAQVIAGALYDAVDSFATSSSQEDDQTLIVIRAS